METYIWEMTEIVEKHYKDNHKSDCFNKARLQSCATVNGDIYATFNVGSTYTEMYLYKVIYYTDLYNFRVFCYKLDEMFDVDD